MRYEPNKNCFIETFFKTESLLKQIISHAKNLLAHNYQRATKFLDFYSKFQK